jgi:uncharacterized membrane protein
MTNPKSTLSIAGHPIHPMLVPFPIAFFVTTLVCDLAFGEPESPFGHRRRYGFWPPAS